MWSNIIAGLLAFAAGIFEFLQYRLMSEQRRYTNWLREDYARANGFSQFCFTTWDGRDKWTTVRHGGIAPAGRKVRRRKVSARVSLVQALKARRG